MARIEVIIAGQERRSLPTGELPDDVLVLAHQAATRFGISVPLSMEAMTTADALRVIRAALVAVPASACAADPGVAS